MFEKFQYDADALYRTNIQSIRDQLNEQVIRAARQFKAPKVTHEYRDNSWHIVIRETAVSPEEMRLENERLRADNRPGDRETFHHPV